MQLAASDPHNLYYYPIDTKGDPVRRTEPTNEEPTFCYLHGSEDTPVQAKTSRTGRISRHAKTAKSMESQ
jgi:hypothetical protein